MFGYVYYAFLHIQFNQKILKYIHFDLISLDRQELTVNDWKKYVFVDECTINISDNKGRSFFKSRIDGKNNPVNFKKIPLKSVRCNLFGVLTSKMVRIFKIPSPFNSQDYFHLLEKVGLADYLKALLIDPIYFVQDGSRVHTTPTILNYLATKFELVTDWPGYSPDLNVIEKVWALMKDRVRKTSEIESITDEDQLFDLCEMVVKGISAKTIENLYRSLPNKINSVIELNGQRTIH